MFYIKSAICIHDILSIAKFAIYRIVSYHHCILLTVFLASDSRYTL